MTRNYSGILEVINKWTQSEFFFIVCSLIGEKKVHIYSVYFIFEVTGCQTCTEFRVTTYSYSYIGSCLPGLV